MATIYMAEKRGGSCAPFAMEMDPYLTQCGLAKVYICTKWRFHPSSRLATIDIFQKLGAGAVSFFLGGAGSPSNTMSPQLRPTSVASSILIQPFGHNRHGLLFPFGEELGPHLTQCHLGRGLPPCEVAS